MPPPDYFHHVEQIREVEKYFNISLEEIERCLNEEHNKFRDECAFDLTACGEDGKEVTISLHISCPDGALAWTAAIVMHSIRIDGLDWEDKRGWHRHGWDRNKQHAENKKSPIVGFDTIKTKRDFLVRVMSELRIRLNKNDEGNTGLFGN